HKITLQTDLKISPTVQVDRDQIRSVILGLVMNAIDAAGQAGWVRLELDSGKNDVAVLAVVDSGPGLAPEIFDRLFEPFSTTKREGIGLGLAAGLQIAKLHNGELHHVDNSRPTRFELRLPLEQLTPCINGATGGNLISEGKTT